MIGFFYCYAESSRSDSMTSLGQISQTETLVPSPTTANKKSSDPPPGTPPPPYATRTSVLEEPEPDEDHNYCTIPDEVGTG